MKFLTTGFVVIAVLVLVRSTEAALIDFESTPTGVYNSVTIGDVTFTAEWGANWDIVDASPGPPISNHSITTGYQNGNPQLGGTPVPFIATLNIANVTSVSVGVGDFDQDIDNCYLYAYDASDTLLASDYYQNPASTYGGDYLTVAASTSIAYVKFWDGDPFANAVLWDNFSYETSSVPEPTTLAIWSTLGALGMIAARRRKTA